MENRDPISRTLVGYAAPVAPVQHILRARRAAATEHDNAQKVSDAMPWSVPHPGTPGRNPREYLAKTNGN